VESLATVVARAAGALPAWRRLPAPRRAETLIRVGELLRDRKSTLAEIITAEIGKPPAEAGGEVQEAIDMAYYMAGEGRRSFGQTVPSELPDKWAMSIREPVGVVAAITAWNFPIAVPSWKILPALVLGNTVVWKPSERAERCAAAFAQVFTEAGVPPGVLTIVTGDGRVGETLVRQPAVSLVSFTGSRENGRHVAIACAELGKRCALELGGKNAVIVLDDADLELAVDGIVWSAFGTSGQRCTSCSRIIVHKAIRAALTEALVERVKSLEIDQGAADRCEKFIREAVAAGARRLTSGATLLDNVTPRMRIAQEELFGPVCVIIEVGSLAEAIAVNNDVPYGLSSSIYTRDVNQAFVAMRELSSGIVYINAGTTGSEVQLPFGGVRGSGNGWREAGQAALDTFSEWKTIYVDYSGRLQRAQIDR